jgi:hypothetical protein
MNDLDTAILAAWSESLPRLLFKAMDVNPSLVRVSGHFNKVYAPSLEGVHLCWSYNSSARFFFDLIDVLRGTPNGEKAQTSYGMSFLT